MPTIIKVEQGGTGVQTVDELKNLLGLKSAAALDTTDDFRDTSKNHIPSSYALSEGIRSVSANSGIIPIERGGTGATTAEDAIRNLGIESTTISYPISIRNGGTGATSAAEARQKLGINPLNIADGGTGATTRDGAIINLFGEFPIPVSAGGTGAITANEAISSLINNSSDTFTIPIEKGGTGVQSLSDLRLQLGLGDFVLKELPTNSVGKWDLNTLFVPGYYLPPDTEDPANIIGLPALHNASTQQPCSEIFFTHVISDITEYPQIKRTYIPDPSDPSKEIEDESARQYIYDNVEGHCAQFLYIVDRKQKINSGPNTGVTSISNPVTDAHKVYAHHIFWRFFVGQVNNSGVYIKYWSDWQQVYSSGSGSVTISTATPAANQGVNGDIWLKYS